MRVNHHLFTPHLCPHFFELYIRNSLILLGILLLPRLPPRVLWNLGLAKAGPGYH